ncbi:MAG: hypothetical protein ACREEC_04725, partial [Thermoplasmata archaeon]
MSKIDFEKRRLLKTLDPEDAIVLYLESIPEERRNLVYALWEMIVDLTGGVLRRAYRYDRQRLLALTEVITDDLPELLQLAPEDQMPLEMKEMFRGMISGFEHMLPHQRITSKDRRQQIMVEIMLGAWLKAGLWVGRGVEWLEVKERHEETSL